MVYAPKNLRDTLGCMIERYNGIVKLIGEYSSRKKRSDRSGMFSEQLSQATFSTALGIR